MKTCRTNVLNELRFQQDIASAADPHVPHEALVRLLSIGLNTFCDIERRLRSGAGVELPPNP